MADQVFNVALGRGHEFARRVLDNDPTNSALIVVVINTTATDATLKDYDTLAAVLGDANTAEVTNTNYSRQTITDSAGGLAATIDDTNDRVDLDIDDITWTSVASGDAWTDLLVCYDNDTGAGTDANIIPLSMHDFVVTPDGSNITAQIAAAGFFRAS